MTFADFETFIYNNENIRQYWDLYNDDKEIVLDRLGKSLVFQYFQTRFHWIKNMAG